jgi:hypothetical protein
MLLEMQKYTDGNGNLFLANEKSGNGVARMA